jgi:hypothetical protein
MSEFRHQTDNKEVLLLAACHEGCQSFEAEIEGSEDAVDELVETLKEEFETCSRCRGSMGFVSQTKRREILD